MDPSARPTGPATLALVREGWDHLGLRRPLAAWASWRRALRIDPDDRAAQEALDRLSQAVELPASARAVYRFRGPADDARRDRWDLAFRGRDLSDLDTAAETFRRLSADDPGDPDARFNLGLCLAWLGRNGGAGAILDATASLLSAAGRDDEAVATRLLREVVRSGVEGMSDVRGYSASIDLTGSGVPASIHSLLAESCSLTPMPSPIEPTPGRAEIVVEEWLDRPPLINSERIVALDQLPRVLAIVLSTPTTLRLSIPDPASLHEVQEALSRLGVEATDPEVTPLPLPQLDTPAWTIRIPAWISQADRHRLYRENIEDYFENRWVRDRLKGAEYFSTPVESALRAASGDRDAATGLEAMIRLAEEIAARPLAVELYQGYPFDRLRSRLGLPLVEPGSGDPAYNGPMSGADLDRLDPAGLADDALAEAVRSSDGLGDDVRTSRFALRLIDRGPAALARADPRLVFASLLRQAIAAGDWDEAIRLADLGVEAARGGRYLVELSRWRAEALARGDRPGQAVEAYRALAAASDQPVWTLLDAAETLDDGGHGGEARTLADQALDLATRGDDQTAEQAVRRFFDRIEP